MLQHQNEIGDTGAECIGEGLKVNSSLQFLWLVSFLSFDLRWFEVCVCIEGKGEEGAGCSVRCFVCLRVVSRLFT